MIEPTNWSVLVEYAAPAEAEPVALNDDRWNALVDAAEDYAGTVTHSTERCSVRVFVDDEPDAYRAVMTARDVTWKMISNVGLPEWPVVRLEALSEAELDAELAKPNFPQLLGLSELAVHLGVTRQRIAELRRRPEFPKPIVELAAGPIWVQGAVDSFVSTWHRHAGRPRAADAPRPPTRSNYSPWLRPPRRRRLHDNEEFEAVA
jgi:hypothetical protein